MTEFWESSFIEKQTMWGLEPSDSAILIKDFFLEKNIKDILYRVWDTAEMQKFLWKMELT